MIAVISVAPIAASAQSEQGVSKVYLNTMREWAKVTNFAENAADTAVGKFKIDLQSDARYQKVLTPELISDLNQFFYEIFVSEETMSELAKIYSKYFTIDEMVGLINFAKSPLGKKMTKVTPDLNILTQKLGLDLVEKHEKEFIEVLSEHIKRAHRGGE